MLLCDDNDVVDDDDKLVEFINGNGDTFLIFTILLIDCAVEVGDVDIVLSRSLSLATDIPLILLYIVLLWDVVDLINSSIVVLLFVIFDVVILLLLIIIAVIDWWVLIIAFEFGIICLYAKFLWEYEKANELSQPILRWYYNDWLLLWNIYLCNIIYRCQLAAIAVIIWFAIVLWKYFVAKDFSKL